MKGYGVSSIAHAPVFGNTAQIHAVKDTRPLYSMRACAVQSNGRLHQTNPPPPPTPPPTHIDSIRDITGAEKTNLKN